MDPQRPSAAAEAAAVTSFYKFSSESEAKTKVKKSAVPALPREYAGGYTQGGGTGMLDTDCMEPAKVSNRNSTEVAINPRFEHEQSSGIVPQTEVCNSKTARTLGTEINKSTDVCQSDTLEHKRLGENVVPPYTKNDSQLVLGLSELNTNEMQCPEQPTQKWKSYAEASKYKTGTTHRQLDDVAHGGKKVGDETHKRSKQHQYPNSSVIGQTGLLARLSHWTFMSREDELIGQRDQLLKESHRLGRECERLKSDNQSLCKEVNDHRHHSKNLQSENKELRECINQQELSVTKAQSAAFSMFSHSASAALPDDNIRKRFSDLFESIAEWARDNAAAPAQVISTHPENLLKWQNDGLLRAIGEVDSMPNLNFDCLDDTAIDTLLNAALAKCFCRDFLGNPFWFAAKSSPVSNAKSPRNEGFDRSDVLNQMLKEMIEYYGDNKPDVHAWRASTVRNLAGSDHVRKQISAEHRHYLEDNILSRYRELIQFPVPQSSKDELVAIIESFSTFSIELWSQKMTVQYCALESFQCVYQRSNAYMELARAVGADEGDRKLDGRPIPVVVQPLILDFGTHDGKDYDKSRVWSKAVVRVSKAEERATMPASGATHGGRFRS